MTERIRRRFRDDIPIQRTALPANDTKESMFGHQNLSSANLEQQQQ